MPRYQAIALAVVTVLGLTCYLIPMIYQHVPRYYKLYRKENSVSVLVVERKMTAIDCFTKQVEIKGTVCVRAQ